MQKGAWLEVLKGQFPEKAKDEIKIFGYTEQDLDFFLLFWLRRDIR